MKLAPDVENLKNLFLFHELLSYLLEMVSPN